MTQKLKILSIVGALSIFAGPAQASDPVYFFSATSDEVTRSSLHLVDGNTYRALTLAKTARATAETKTDRMLASYNMCMALLKLRRIEQAQPKCNDAAGFDMAGLEIVDGPRGLKQLIDPRPQLAELNK